MSFNRREFCKKSATIFGGIAMAGTIPIQYSCRRAGPGDTVRVGLVGCRNMGFTNVTNFITNPDVQIVALCDVDNSVLEKRAADLEKFAFENEIEGYTKPSLESDFRNLLDRKDIDALIVATPDHWHALITIMACQAGKDVYVEKPMANSIGEADLMVRAGERYKRVIQVGQWQRSGPHWMDAMNYIQSGKLGKISNIDVWLYGGNPLPKVPDSDPPPGVDYDMWLGPAPLRPFNTNRFHYNFRWFWDYAGGKMTDWGVHLIDMAMMMMEVVNPHDIQSEGGNFVYPDHAMETPDTLTVKYRFGDLMVTWNNDFGKSTNEYGMGHGLIFYGENGKMLASRNGWQVIPETRDGDPLIDVVEKQPSTGKDLGLHVRNFIDSVKSRNRETNCSAEIGRNVARVAHMGNISYRTGESIHWNGERGRFSEDVANEYLLPEYRKPWALPKI
jgi:predicted dehydrogenase